MGETVEGYWKCPRCDGVDLYKTPRVVGQVGMIGDFLTSLNFYKLTEFR
jgi:hypothetical protein